MNSKAKTSKEKMAEQGFGREDTHIQRSASTGVHADVLSLQRSAGNRAVNRALNHAATNLRGIQAKPTINQPDDRYELEADRIANQVMGMPESKARSRQEPSGTPETARKTQNSRGQPLNVATRQFMDPRFGRNLDNVRIHTDARAAASAQAIGARAYTIGRDIRFARGEFAPHTRAGRTLLAHEITHVIQQSSHHERVNGPAVSRASGPQIQRTQRSGSAVGSSQQELAKLLKEKNYLLNAIGTASSNEEREGLRENLFTVQAQIDKINQRFLRLEQQQKQRTEWQRGLAQIRANVMKQATDMSDIEIDIEIRKLEQEKSIETNRKRLQVIDAIIGELKSAKVEDRKRRGPETTDTSRRERMTALAQSSREDAAHLVRRMDKADLTRLAKIERDRMGLLGMELAEATPGQTATGVSMAGIPIAGPFLALPSEIVSDRFEEKKAVERLAAAAVRAGGPSEMISVPDRDQLTNLIIERSGDKVTFWKTDVLHGLEHMNVTSMGTRDEKPQRYWEFAPSDLVTLSVPGEGEMMLPAYAWLHREDEGLQRTFQEWASLISEGATATKASIKATKIETSSIGSAATPTSKTKIAAGKPSPPGPSSRGIGSSGSPDVSGPGFVKVRLSDDVVVVDNDIASSLAQRDMGLPLQAGQTRMVTAADRLSTSRKPALTPTSAKQFGNRSEIPHNRAFPVISRPPVKPKAIRGLLKKLRDAGVGGRGGSISTGGVADRRIVAEAMIAGARTGKTPMFMTADRKIIQGLARIAFRKDPTFINPDSLGGFPTVLAALEARGLSTFPVSIGKYKLVVRPVQRSR